MARKGGTDRGLVKRTLKNGRTVWYVRLFHEGREPWFGGFDTKTAARAFYENKRTEQREGRFFPEHQRTGGTKFQDVIDAFMASNVNKTARQDAHYAAFWLAWFPGATLKALTSAAIDKAKVELIERGLSAQTVVHYLKFLRHVLNVAVRDGKVQLNPLAKVSFPKLHKGKLRFLSLDEELQVYQVIDPLYRPWLRFAILTGLRREEQFSLRWTEVDTENGLLTLAQTKAGGVRYVRLNEEAKAILKGFDSWQRSVWAFPSQNPTTNIDSDNFYARVYLPAVQRAKLEGVTWHTLRHTFASRLAMGGATEQDIAACLGHSTTALVRRYAHLSPTHLQGVMEKVSAFGKPVITEPNRDGIEIGGNSLVGNGSQAIEKVGAGDGI